MDPLPPFSEAIVVDSVEEEYARVKQETCTCGAPLEVRGQSFAEDDEGRHYDILRAECGDCKATRDLLFHVGPVAEPVPVEPPHPVAATRDPRIARGTLDLCALIACVFALAFAAFAWYLSTAACVAMGAAFWFAPVGPPGASRGDQVTLRPPPP